MSSELLLLLLNTTVFNQSEFGILIFSKIFSFHFKYLSLPFLLQKQK